MMSSMKYVVLIIIGKFIELDMCVNYFLLWSINEMII